MTPTAARLRRHLAARVTMPYGSRYPAPRDPASPRPAVAPDPHRMTPPLTLVTGSAGRVGRAVVAELLARGHPTRGFDLAPTPGCPDHVVGSLTDPAAVRRAMSGVGTLVHLAATPDDDDFLTTLLPNNLLGVFHVLEAA